SKSARGSTRLIMFGSSWMAVTLVAAAHAYLMVHRLLAYLRYFQQEGYDARRFIKWVGFRSLTDPAFWLAVAAIGLFSTAPIGAVALFVAGATLLVRMQPDPRVSGKITLNMTWRATRVLVVAVILGSVFWVEMAAVYPASDLRAAFFASVM